MAVLWDAMGNEGSAKVHSQFLGKWENVMRTMVTKLAAIWYIKKKIAKYFIVCWKR